MKSRTCLVVNAFSRFSASLHDCCASHAGLNHLRFPERIQNFRKNSQRVSYTLGHQINNCPFGRASDDARMLRQACPSLSC